ncbi:MAG: permease-like cell division protein FtsX [Candidatus Caenarcaniphilales bacterium]|nr:permease-like cell division protein FtsX [Candidatus Caenarcaniphilales bacterium]
MLVRIFAEAGLGMWRSGWQNIVIISILMSTLVVFGIMLEFSVSLKKIAANLLGSQTEFSIHLTDGTDPDSMKRKLNKFKEVVNMKLTTKEEAWEQTKSMLQIDLDDSLNSMPNTLTVRVSKPQEAAPLIYKVNGWKKEVEHISYAPTMVRKLNVVKNLLILLGTFISGLLAAATFVINFNTIELVIRSRKEELNLLRFMGVTNWFIKGPFILQGILYGLVSALVAGSLLITIDVFARYNWQKIMMQQFGLVDLFWPSGEELTQVLIILTIIGILFSSSSSFWATERRLSA